MISCSIRVCVSRVRLGPWSASRSRPSHCRRRGGLLTSGRIRSWTVCRKDGSGSSATISAQRARVRSKSTAARKVWSAPAESDSSVRLACADRPRGWSGQAVRGGRRGGRKRGRHRSGGRRRRVVALARACRDRSRGAPRLAVGAKAVLCRTGAEARPGGSRGPRKAPRRRRRQRLDGAVRSGEANRSTMGRILVGVVCAAPPCIGTGGRPGKPAARAGRMDRDGCGGPTRRAGHPRQTAR